MKSNTLLSAVIGALATFSFATATACPPPPPPPPQEMGESEEAYGARVIAFHTAQEEQHQAWLHARQVRLWDESDSVFLARIERVQPMQLPFSGDVQRITMRPLRDAGPLKGRRYRSSFNLAYTEETTCGPLPAFEAIGGNVGDTFVVFVQGGRPHQRTVQQTIAPANITDDRIRAALAQAGVTQSAPRPPT